jgi:transcriptional regulator GlxA family with amidase domain
MTVIEWLHAERLAMAQRLLEGSDHSIDVISTQVGFGSPESLRIHFRRAFGVSPMAWRKTFKGRD